MNITTSALTGSSADKSIL